MRAVIIATGQSTGDPFLADRIPVPMLPLVDRPFIQHVVEYCVGQGVRVFDWVLCHLPEEIEQFLGSGERWGAKFHYHLVRDPFRPYARLRVLALGEQEGDLILLGHADRLPAFRLADAESNPPTEAPFLYGWRVAGAPADVGWRWSGWGVFPAEAWRNLPRANVDEAGLDVYLRSAAAARPCRQEVSRPLDVRSFGDVLVANRTVLRGEFPGLLLNGKTAQPNVRLSRNALIHPSAQLIAPVYVGSGCEVAAGARLGPNVVVGPGCVIDRHATLANAVVLAATYVGERVELDSVFVDRDRVTLTLPEGLGQAEENCAVAGLAESNLLGWTGRILSMGIGLVLLLLATPLLLVTALVLKVGRRGKVLHVRSVLRLPAGREEKIWSTFGLCSFSPLEGQNGEPEWAGLKHFFLRFLPALINVAGGDLRLVGLPPRTPDQVKRLGADWQALYLQSRAGIVSERLLHCGCLPEEEAYATEGAYAVVGGVAHDLFLLLRYLLRVLWRGNAGIPGPSRTVSGADDSLAGGTGRLGEVGRGTAAPAGSNGMAACLAEELHANPGHSPHRLPASVGPKPEVALMFSSIAPEGKEVWPPRDS